MNVQDCGSTPVELTCIFLFFFELLANFLILLTKLRHRRFSHTVALEELRALSRAAGVSSFCGIILRLLRKTALLCRRKFRKFCQTFADLFLLDHPKMLCRTHKLTEPIGVAYLPEVPNIVLLIIVERDKVSSQPQLRHPEASALVIRIDAADCW